MNIAWTRVSLLVKISFFAIICASLASSTGSRARRPLTNLYRRSSASETSDETIILPMPNSGHRRPSHNEYLCTSASLPPDERYIIEYDPRADPRVVHHMLLFGCKSPSRHGSWDCKISGDICSKTEDAQIMYAWALNASGTNLPEGVGYKVGQHTTIYSLVLQVHYGHVEDVPDLSSVSQEALVLRTTQQRQQFVAGIFLIGAGSRIASGKKEAYVDAACKFQGPKTIYPFAFRTHAHSLGKQIIGYVVKPGGKWKVIGTRSPQDPQAFYPVGPALSVEVSDMLAARCVYNTEKKHSTVYMGPDSEDEMCNFYIMYFTKNDGKRLYQDDCWSNPPRSLRFPANLPPLLSHTTPTDIEEEDLHSHSHGHTHQTMIHTGRPSSALPTDSSEMLNIPKSSVMPKSDEVTTVPKLSGEPSHSGRQLFLAEDWPLNNLVLPDNAVGQVSAAAIDAEGTLHVLHRGPVTWDFNSFRDDNVYRHILDGSILSKTLLQFSHAGQLVRAWGESLFYMPHGLTIDHQGSFWVTDVAMHQVFKFHKVGDTRPTLVLGKAFHPGKDVNSFCQPSSVAVERSGVFYVTDGYCNSRIIKFSATGIVLHVWNAPVAGTSLFIPHKAILNAAETILYVADRENHRIVSYDISNTNSHGKKFGQGMEGAPYAISFNGSSSSAISWPMYGIFGGEKDGKRLMGFVLDDNGKIVGSWGPKEGFDNPHDLAVDTVHHAVYVTEIGPNRIWKFVPVPSISSDLTKDLDDILQSVSSPTTTLPKARVPQEQAPQPSSLPKARVPQQQVPQPSSPKQNEEESTTTYNYSSSEESKMEDELEALANISNVLPEEAQQKKQGDSQRSSVNVGVIVTVVAVGALAIIISVGVAKEYRQLKFKGWRLIHGDTDGTIGVKPSGSTVRREKKGKKNGSVPKKKKKKKMTPYNKLQSVLGPSKLGFSRLKTYDSDSEEEEFPVFNRV